MGMLRRMIRSDESGPGARQGQGTQAGSGGHDIDAMRGLEPLEPRLLLSGTISAEFVEVDNSSALTGYKTYDIEVSSVDDWMSAALFIELSQGSIYQDPVGTDREPNGQLLASFPTLAFDSYISANGNPISILAGANEIGAGGLQFDENGISITWFDRAENDTGTFVIGRVTLSDDAAGSLGLQVNDRDYMHIGDGSDSFLTWNTFTDGDLVDMAAAPARPATPVVPPAPSGPIDYTMRFVEVDNSSALTGYKTYDLQVTSEFDWSGAALLIELSEGSIYQDPLGSDLEPSPGAFAAFPTLEFDTYVTTYGNEASIAGAAGDVGGDQLQFDTQELDISWFDVPKNDVGTYSIGRVTLSDDSAGIMRLLIVGGSQKIISSTDSFTQGNLTTQVFVPEGETAPKLPPPPAPILAQFVEVDNSSALDGFKTFDLQITTDTDWQDATLVIDLSQGSIYQDTAGTDLAPNAATFSAFPAIEFDSYVTADGDFTSIGGGGGGGAVRFDSSQIDIRWSGVGSDDVGTITLGRVTLSEDAVGSLSLTVSADRNEHSESGAFVLGDLHNLQAPPTPPAAAAADFTGDGRADILWWDSRTGRNRVWEMNRTSFISSIDLPELASKHWEAVGTGDLTGDGKADILWRHSRSGRNMVTKMDGTDLQAHVDLKRLRNRAWVVGGVGDFTGDGKNDILWRNTRNGRNSVWEMDGTAFVDGIALKTVKSSDWRIAGVSDLTGDGKADVLWRNSRNGRNSFWEMDGTTFQSNTRIKQLKSQKWQVAGVGDYTGDGLADILWRDTRQGKNRVWEMNGPTFQNQIAIQTQADKNVQPAGTLLGLWE